MSYFAQRDAGGAITGVFRNLQPQPGGHELTDGIELADDNPEVLAFLAAVARRSNSAAALAVRDREQTLEALDDSIAKAPAGAVKDALQSIRQLLGS